MASAGLLLLLLVSSSLILSSLSAPSSSNQQGNLALQKRTDAKKVALTAVKYTERILTAAAPFIGLIPFPGPHISAFINLAGVLLSLTGNFEKNPNLDLMKEFENLNMKIDKNQKELTWNIWASQYYNHENEIDVAWKKFQKLAQFLQNEKSNDEKKKHIESFRSDFKPFASVTDLLANALTKDRSVFLTDFGKLLADNVRCHEDDIRTYTQLIYELIYHGSIMNLFYYRLQGLDKAEEIADTFYDVASAMFKTHMYCIEKSMDYVEMDVRERIDDTKKTELAKKIRVFLENTYNRYDWMVVVFLSKNSEHTFFSIRNKHILSGFIGVKKGELTVAVARQVKGTHTKANTVSEAIKKCVKDSVLCKDVPKTLNGCEETKAYTAVHAFISESHDSTSATDAKESYESMSPESPAAQTPFFYKGKCAKSPGVKTGKFIVLIKSDNEIEEKDPCHAKTCGGNERGKCVLLDNAIAVCECERPYYGENCEESLDDYKKKMNEEIPKN